MEKETYERIGHILIEREHVGRRTDTVNVRFSHLYDLVLKIEPRVVQLDVDGTTLDEYLGHLSDVTFARLRHVQLFQEVFKLDLKLR